MRYILQDFEDTRKIGTVLERMGLPYSWHKVVPFVGELDPEPEVAAGEDVILFGSYTLWRYAERRGLRPGVFRIRPTLRETAWQPFLLNGEATVSPLRDLPDLLSEPERPWFVRPVADSKEIAGRVMNAGEIVALARQVCVLKPEELIGGSLSPETEMMLAPPRRIRKEWRVWVVADVVVTASLYVEGRRIVYRPEIDDDARAFAERLVGANPGYAPAYVMDVCRTEDGLRLLETNCLNAAGFYAADLQALVEALEGLDTARP